MKTYIGIDPGISGAIAFVADDLPMMVVDLPTKVRLGTGRLKRQIDAEILRQQLDDILMHTTNAVIGIEDIHAMPINGKFGMDR